jgi:hypothetical protein
VNSFPERLYMAAFSEDMLSEVLMAEEVSKSFAG